MYKRQIIAFGQPFAAYMYPDAFLVPHNEAEEWMWIAQFVLIDGKMRGLFTLLFGAGLYLFMEKAWSRGEGRALQAPPAQLSHLWASSG